MTKTRPWTLGRAIDLVWGLPLLAMYGAMIAYVAIGIALQIFSSVFSRVLEAIS